MITDRLDEIEARAAAATSGRWHWAGNTDTGEPYLATWIPGAGRCQVFDIGFEDRSTTGRAADEVRASAREFELGETEDLVREWATDNFGEPVRDARLRFSEDLMMVNARDLVVYEVAPQATTREDPQVYRADIVAIRHPDAAFIAASRTDVPDMVAALQAVLALHQRGNWASQGWVDGGFRDFEGPCVGCEATDTYAVKWPCPTVTAITTALTREATS